MRQCQIGYQRKKECKEGGYVFTEAGKSKKIEGRIYPQ